MVLALAVTPAVWGCTRQDGPPDPDGADPARTEVYIVQGRLSLDKEQVTCADGR